MTAEVDGREVIPLTKWIISSLLALFGLTFASILAQQTFNLKKDFPHLKLSFKPHNIKKSWVHFWLKFPKRVWGLFIEALLIPAYRHEWGVYSNWNWRIPEMKPEEINWNRIQRKKRIQNMNKKIPVPVSYKSHDHDQCARVTINVAGKKFQTQLRTLNRYPNTLLGDPKKRIRYYDPEEKEYFFDRCRSSFEAILTFYQSGGELKRPSNIPIEIFWNDINFYEISKDAIDKFKDDERFFVPESADMPKNLLKRKIWLLFEYPDSSFQARIVAILSIFVVITSTVLICIETLTEFKYFKTEKVNGELVKIVDEDKMSPTLSDPFFFVETICIIWFSFEFLMRIASCPSLFQFITSYINIIDFVAITPYFISLLTHYFNDTGEVFGASKNSDKKSVNLIILRTIRLFRIFRIFKISRHSKGLKVLGKSLKASLQELTLMMLFLFIGVVLFSSAIFFAESTDPKTMFTSIPKSFWWAINTMTTVGYGDLIPVTTWGQIIGSLCAISGILTIALPVPIIVSNFNNFYHYENINEELTTEENYVQHCPYLPGDEDDDDDEDVEEDAEEGKTTNAGLRNRIKLLENQLLVEKGEYVQLPDDDKSEYRKVFKGKVLAIGSSINAVEIGQYVLVPEIPNAESVEIDEEYYIYNDHEIIAKLAF